MIRGGSVIIRHAAAAGSADPSVDGEPESAPKLALLDVDG